MRGKSQANVVLSLEQHRPNNLLMSALEKLFLSSFVMVFKGILNGFAFTLLVPEIGSLVEILESQTRCLLVGGESRFEVVKDTHQTPNSLGSSLDYLVRVLSRCEALWPADHWSEIRIWSVPVGSPRGAVCCNGVHLGELCGLVQENIAGQEVCIYYTGFPTWAWSLTNLVLCDRPYSIYVHWQSLCHMLEISNDMIAKNISMKFCIMCVKNL